MSELSTSLEARLSEEVTRLRTEAAELPAGALRCAVEEIAEFAEAVLDRLRRNGTLEMPAFGQRAARPDPPSD